MDKQPEDTEGMRKWFEERFGDSNDYSYYPYAVESFVKLNILQKDLFCFDVGTRVDRAIKAVIQKYHYEYEKKL